MGTTGRLQGLSADTALCQEFNFAEENRQVFTAHSISTTLLQMSVVCLMYHAQVLQPRHATANKGIRSFCCHAASHACAGPASIIIIYHFRVTDMTSCSLRCHTSYPSKLQAPQGEDVVAQVIMLQYASLYWIEVPTLLDFFNVMMMTSVSPLVIKTNQLQDKSAYTASRLLGSNRMQSKPWPMDNASCACLL